MPSGAVLTLVMGLSLSTARMSFAEITGYGSTTPSSTTTNTDIEALDHDATVLTSADEGLSDPRLMLSPSPVSFRRSTSSILISPEKFDMAQADAEPSIPLKKRLSSFRGGMGSTDDLTKNKMGILVHGCHLQADGWEHIVWGVPPAQLGRIPHAALLAWEERQTLAAVCFGTGASQTARGELEGDYTLRMLFERLPRLSEFDAFAKVPLDKLEQLLRRTASAETVSKNTVEEVREGLQRFADAGCRRAVLVSSPTHLPRCLACACTVEEEHPGLFTGSVWASPSDTSYKDSSAGDVVVVEPPHRGDRDKELDALPFHAMVKRSYRVQGEQRVAFLQRFEALLGEFGV